LKAPEVRKIYKVAWGLNIDPTVTLTSLSVSLSSLTVRAMQMDSNWGKIAFPVIVDVKPGPNYNQVKISLKTHPARKAAILEVIDFLGTTGVVLAPRGKRAQTSGY